MAKDKVIVIFTREAVVCVTIMPIKSAPTAPKAKPAFLNANGIVKTPPPRLLFTTCNNAPQFLKMNKNALLEGGTQQLGSTKWWFF